MPDILMPALSPTMEAGTLSRWLKKQGDPVKPGDVLAEIETDKATMEVEAIDEGTLTRIVVPDGTEDVKVGALIAVIAAEGEGEDVGAFDATGEANASPPRLAGDGPGAAPTGTALRNGEVAAAPAGGFVAQDGGEVAANTSPPPAGAERVKASPLAKRLAELRGIELSALTGSGPGGRIVKADVDAAGASASAARPIAGQAAGGSREASGEEKRAAQPSPPPPGTPDRAAQPGGGGVKAPAPAPESPAGLPAEAADIPHQAVKLSNMRKVIARRLTESKQTVPHYYLAVDVRLDALLKLRGELNASLDGQGVKLSVNDLLIKALALALRQVPDANVSFTGDSLLKFGRADISVAVAIPAGLITPIITGADQIRVSEIAMRMKELAARAKDGKLQPHEYQGGTASLSNLGMYGIKQFEAVINPPQGMILAVGAGERRPWVDGDAIVPATIMTATGSFDHRAIDGAVGAQLMQAFRGLVEQPLTMLA
ncbi:MAG: 2-oxo acid dehydrogenase subunit E2 [Sphingomonadaceae bacterium]|nr:2-oxo acid dehydrogenase subunit E2 [Sphingomonadaceae bacterium]